MKLGQYWHQYEFLQPKPYSSLGEGFIALLATLLWFTVILVRHHLPETGDWSLGESLTEAFSFAIFAAVPIFGLATPQGEQFAKQVLLPKQGLGFQSLLCAALAALIASAKALNLNSRHFDWIDQLNTLVIAEQFWLNLALFLGGVFVALRIPFVVQAIRQQHQIALRWQLCSLLLLNTLYLALHVTGNRWEGLMVSLAYGLICLGLTWPSQLANAVPPRRLVPSDFWLMVLCVAILYWFSIPSFSFGTFIGVDLFIVVMVYGSGLGRAHFGYSFEMRRKDWPTLGAIILAAVLVLVPLAIASGFVQPTRPQNPFSLLKLAVYFALFTLRVGIFEEVYFRSGLMVLFRDWLQHRDKGRSPQATVWLSPLGCSVLFGISHIGNEAGTHSPLSLWQYRGLYVVLATSASLFYCAAFAKTNRLAAPILIHGCVDTLAVVLLGGALAVPF